MSAHVGPCWSKLALNWHKVVHVGPSWFQVSPKVAPSWSHVGLCWAKLAPSWPMLVQVGPKMAPSGPQVGPSWPKLAQVGPKLVPIWAQVVSCWLMLPLAPLPPERISQAMLSKMSTKALPLRRRCERSSNKQMLFNVANVQITSRCLSICLADVQVTRMFYPAGAFKTKEVLWNF